MSTYFRLTLITVFLPVAVYSQKLHQESIDSLLNLINSYPHNDTIKVNMLNETARKVYYTDINQTFALSVRALELAEELGYKKGIAEAYRLKGIYYYYLQKYLNAFENLNRSLDLYDECTGCVTEKAQTLANLGDVLVYFKPDSIQLAIGVYREAITLLDQMNELGRKSGVLINMGRIYWKEGDYSETIDVLNKALDIELLLGNKMRIAACLSNLGILHKSLGDYNLSLSKYLDACRYFEEIHSNFHLLECYCNIGNVLSAMGRYDEALTYYQKTLDLSDQIGSSNPSINAIIGLGEIFKKQGRYQQALESFQQALVISDSLKYSEGILHTYLLIGETYFVLGKYNEAQKYSNKSLEMAIRLNDFEGQIGNYELQAKIYEKQDMPSLSLNFFKKFKLFQDSLFKESNVKKITALEKQYEFKMEKQAIVSEQAKKDAVQNAKIKRQRLLVGVFIGGFVLSLMFVFVIMRSLSRKRKVNMMLALQKDEISSQAEQLRTTNKKLVELNQFKQGMTSMIVHDLKNPLSMILNVSEKNPGGEIRRSKSAAKQMMNMVLNILDINMYEDTEMKAERRAFSITKIAQKSITQISFIAEQKNIFISNKIDKAIGVLGDAKAVERIFENLISNAIKYSSVNGIIELESIIIEEKGLVIISVKDTGQGISKEYHEKVFEKFTKIREVNTGSVYSTGLGLTFCKLAVEAQGGEIWIDENYTSGACISFSLPLCDLTEVGLAIPKIETHSCILTMREKQALQKYLPQLVKLELYEISAFRELFREIEKDGIVNKEWLEKLKAAVDYANEKQFENLITQIRLEEVHDFNC